MPKTILQFYEGAQKYVVLFNTFALQQGLVGKAQADHICYKCSTSESFESMRKLFEGESVYIYQSIISSRRIAYIRLKEGIVTALGTILYLELSDQKPDGSQHEGFDHIEVYPQVQSYDDMVSHLERTELVIHVERPHHTTDDIDIGSGFLFRCTQGPLIKKIKNDEME